MMPEGYMNTALRTVFRSEIENHLENIMISLETDNEYDEGIYIGSTLFTNLNPLPYWDKFLYTANQYLIDKTILSATYTDNFQAHSKAIWLTDEYLKNGKFDNPLCSHWNPRRGEIEIHPGASRTNIISLFSPTANVETYYFSTYGVKPDWIGDFNRLNYSSLMEVKNSYPRGTWTIGISADHGTFIPHITVDGNQTGPNGAIWHEKCRNILQTKKLWINRDIGILNLFNKVNNKESADMIIIIKNEELTIQDLLRLSILVFLNYNWEDSSIKIENQSNDHNLKIM